MDDLDELLNATMAALDSFGFNRAAETVARASTEIERLRAEVEALREALKKLSQGLDCGCVPCTGTCKNQESLLDVIRERQQIARRALEGK